MRIGIVLPIAQEDGMAAPASYAEIREVALEAETQGLDSIWVFDHLVQQFDGVTTGFHECWTILAAIAEATSRVELGTVVMCTAFRNAALLAKMAATLDHVSDGRLILGIGCGWHDPEFESFGYPTDHKVGRFEEALKVITDLIRRGRADLDGRWVTARDAVLAPPVRPDLPILIAAKQPRMLDLTATHADSWNTAWFGVPDERLAGRRADLAAACERVGRDPATLEVTVGLIVRYPDLMPDGWVDDLADPALRGTPEEVAAGLAAHAAGGAGHVIANLEPCTPEAVRRYATAARLMREAQPA